MSRPPPDLRPLVIAALALFPIVGALFWVGTPLGLGGALYAALLVELMPALAVAQLPAVEGETLPRVPVYASSGVVILVLGSGGMILGIRNFGVAGMGIGPASWMEILGWTLAFSLAAVLLVFLVFFFRKAVGLRESPLLIQLLPKTTREKAVFVLLSLAAGGGEELAYRGFLIPALASVFGGEWGAALVSSAVFGVLHAYQGWLGIARTAVLGFLLAGGYLISGSLWPAIFAHAILDLVAGLVVGEALVKD
jgi:membrane protease YdiL (CAAX protease family)